MTNNEIVIAKIAELVDAAEASANGIKTVPVDAMEDFSAFLLDNYPPVTTPEEKNILSTFFGGNDAEERITKMAGEIDDLPPALVPVFALRYLLLINKVGFHGRGSEKTGELIDRYQECVLAA